jgi:hypothetical protein
MTVKLMESPVCGSFSAFRRFMDPGSYMLTTLLIVFNSFSVQALTVRTAGSSEKIRPGAETRSATTAAISAARNEFEAFQIVIMGPAENVSVTATDLSGDGGTIKKPYLYREEYMDCLHPSGPDGATGLWPDALIPDIDDVVGEQRNAFPFDVPSGENRVIWVDFLVPQTAVAGTYTGTVSVSSTNDGDASVPVVLLVRDFSLPSTSTLRSFFGTGYGSLQKGHGSSYGDSLFVTLKQRYHQLILDHRITASGFDDGDPTLRRIKERYGAFMDGTAPTRLPGAKYTSIEAIHLDSWREWVDSTKAWSWFDRLFRYTCDEPPAGCAYEDINTRAAEIKAADPDFRSLVTEDIDNVIANNVEESIDLITPVINFMHNKPGNSYAGSQAAEYAAYTAPGDIKELWMYQSCMSQGCGGTSAYHEGWASYMIDHVAMRHRAMPWLAFQWGATGELYYSVDYAFSQNGNDPWTNQWYFTGNGDGTLLYPGTPEKIGGTANIPVASIRLKMIREAYEDYEYLNILKKGGDSTYAMETAARLFPNPWTQPSPDELYTARAEMADRITALPVRHVRKRTPLQQNESFFSFDSFRRKLVIHAGKMTGESLPIDGNLTITTIHGRTVFSTVYKGGSSFSFTIPKLSKGVYVINYRLNDSRMIGRCIAVR